MKDVELARGLRTERPPVLLDVRSAQEFASGHIPGAVHAPLPSLLAVVHAAAPDKHALVVLVCELGPRAQLARVLLKMRGYRNLDLLDGHMAGWRNADRPLEKGG